MILSYLTIIGMGELDLHEDMVSVKYCVHCVRL